MPLVILDTLLEMSYFLVYSRVYGGRGLPKQHDYRYPTPQKPDYITLKNAPATPPFKRVNVQPGVAKFHRKNHEVLNPTGKQIGPAWKYLRNYLLLTEGFHNLLLQYNRQRGQNSSMIYRGNLQLN